MTHSASSSRAGFAESGAFLLGRLTYDNFAAYWPNQPADDPVAGPMNETPKYVVSTSLTEPLHLAELDADPRRGGGLAPAASRKATARRTSR